ncbi:MAG: bifunctional 2-C-methyl-D-erythritol 4-phosphate cytidylyltransferase/2-C-methyl-D-erythritol 2,4-cyclodiphosphate synthase [Methyloligellaceae bacterium]
MDSKIRNIVIIVAAGRGSRMQTDSGSDPKQYLQLAGKTILNHCISSLASVSFVDAILTVIHPDDKELYYSSIPSDCDKLLPPAFGGRERQQSVLNGLQAITKHNPENVYIHDAARPFITPDIMQSLLHALGKADGALPGVAVADTLKRVKGMQVSETIARDDLWRAQTPQAFNFAKILAAHENAAKNATDIQFTDDASIAEWHGLSVTMVQGSEKIRKLTTLEDLEWAQSKMEQNMQQPQGSYRTGSGFDVHAFTEGDHVILCGVNIPHNKALKGHSDADVAMHALTDAIYGAIADGDIGIHFPPSDPQWKGAASHIFLEHAVNQVKKRNGVIQNLDITLMCEEPKIGPNSMAMRNKLAEIMDFPVDRISVKATTTEQLGFTGRREGIACMATVSVWLPE